MKSLWANIFKSKNVKQESVAAILKRIPLFDELSWKELRALEKILHTREYARDELIFRQGDAGVGMYIIEKGKVGIRLEPAQIIVAELVDGEFFGELALLDASARSASAIALENCKMLGFFQPDLFDIIERDPKLGVKIVLKLSKIIGDRLKAANVENHELRNSLNELSKKTEEQNNE